MLNSNEIPEQALPSTAVLLRSTLMAAAVALLLLLTLVLPAEYGIDPTGIGRILGLTEMGEIKVSLAKEVAAENKAALAATSAPVPVPVSIPLIEKEKEKEKEKEPTEQAPANHEMQLSLAPNEAAEIKVKMLKDSQTSYEWWSDKGAVNFDIHGDSKALNIKYHNYSKGSEKRNKGMIKAAFDGHHGWFWRNRTKETVQVTLQTSGDYLEIIRLE